MPSQAPSSLATIVGQNIRIARDAAKLTQRGLAGKVDVDPMMVSKWERGKHRPSDANLGEIAIQTKRDLHWFFVDHSAEFEAAA